MQFTRRDQIQWIESQIRQVEGKPSPVKNKKLAMLNDLVVLVRNLAEPTYPSVVYCAEVFEHDEKGESEFSGWVVAITPEKFEEAVFSLLRKGNQSRYYRISEQPALERRPKMELFHLYPRMLVDGWTRASKNVQNYMYQP